MADANIVKLCKWFIWLKHIVLCWCLSDLNFNSFGKELSSTRSKFIPNRSVCWAIIRYLLDLNPKLRSATNTEQDSGSTKDSSFAKDSSSTKESSSTSIGQNISPTNICTKTFKTILKLVSRENYSTQAKY